MCLLFVHNLILKQKDEFRINNDIMWFSSNDKRKEWKKQHIKNVEKYLDIRNVERDLEEVNHEILPMTSIPRTDAGFLNLETERNWSGRETKPVSCLISLILSYLIFTLL